jgi:hypothetical protein
MVGLIATPKDSGIIQVSDINTDGQAAAAASVVLDLVVAAGDIIIHGEATPVVVVAVGEFMEARHSPFPALGRMGLVMQVSRGLGTLEFMER